MQLGFVLTTAGRAATRSVFTFVSNVAAMTIGLLFLGALLALIAGVGQFLERYYTRTMELTEILVFQNPDAAGAAPFDQTHRHQLRQLPGVKQLLYFDVGFAEIALAQDRSTTVALRPAIADDPEIRRQELVAGTNLPPATNPLAPLVVLSLNRAQRLSDLSPDELVGREIAITVDRSLQLESAVERATLYGTIAGIVNETPDDAVYLDYSVLAMISAWKRDVTAADSPSEPPVELEHPAIPDQLSIPPEAERESTIEPANPASVPHPADPLPTPAEPPPIDGSPGISSPPVPERPSVSPPAMAVTTRFRHSSLADTWAAVRETVADDSLVYPHLRFHLASLDDVLTLREHFRDQGLATTSVLDDVAALRELRNLAALVGTSIGLITLVAAMCSIFNTVMASVERRTQEIGLLRALGASSPTVLATFLVEGAIFALTGGLLACAALTWGAGSINEWALDRLGTNAEFARLRDLRPQLFVVEPMLNLQIVGIGILVSLVAGFPPALHACRIEPVEALRHSA
ncbi:MAG: FtsX-like permease family protein [Planctomycetaceae bacterium]|nr:FtsX-like permease family protein [Planctomycetaceae bacterium]